MSPQYLIYPDDGAMVLGATRRSQAGSPPPCEYRMLTRDGRLVRFRDEAALIRNQDGQPCALYGVMPDITERKGRQWLVQLRIADRRLCFVYRNAIVTCLALESSCGYAPAHIHQKKA